MCHRRTVASIALVSLVALALAACATSCPQSIAGTWKQLGVVEDRAHQQLFTLNVELGVPTPKWILTIHEVVEITRSEDGTYAFLYADEPCCLVVDVNADATFAFPREVRYKTTAASPCHYPFPRAIRRTMGPDGRIVLVRDDPPDDRSLPPQQVAFAFTATPTVVHVHQLPQLDGVQP